MTIIILVILKIFFSGMRYTTYKIDPKHDTKLCYPNFNRLAGTQKRCLIEICILSPNYLPTAV